MPFSSVLGSSSVIKPGVCTSSTRPSVPYEGQLIYETDTDLVKSYSGAAWATVGPTASGVVQVKSTTKTDVFTMSSTSFADVTGLSVTITPTSASNKILVMVTMLTSNSVDNTLYARLRRDSTDIGIGDAAGSRTQVTGANFTADGTAADQIAMSFLDSPATTSATTYSVQIAGGSAVTMSVNAAATDTNTSGRPRGISTITVFEVTP